MTEHDPLPTAEALVDALIDAVAEDAFGGREDRSPETNAARDELLAALAAQAVPAADADVPRWLLRGALAYVGQRTDGTTAELARRAELWMRESHSLLASIDVPRAIREQHSAPAAPVSEAVPVAWMAPNGLTVSNVNVRFDGQDTTGWTPLYTHPPVSEAKGASGEGDAGLNELLTVLGMAGVQVNGGTHGDPWTVKLPAAQRGGAEPDAVRGLPANWRAEAGDWINGDVRSTIRRLADELEAALALPVGRDEGKPVGWVRRDFIRDNDGTPIGMDEPEVWWHAERPDHGSGWSPLYADYAALLAKYEAEKARADALAGDAGRYRWLKIQSPLSDQVRILSTPWGLWDAAIDAALHGQGAE